jgi:hypothetical protein
MLIMQTIEDPTNPLGELVSTQRIAVGLDPFSLGVYPLGFYQPDTMHPSAQIALSLDSKDYWDFSLSWRGSENPVWRNP